jgi:hypothetical protein
MSPACTWPPEGAPVLSVWEARTSRLAYLR